MNDTTCTAHRWRLLVLLCLMAAATSVAAAADWPHWRGPGYDGKADASGIFGRGPFTLRMAWSRPLGAGCSGISVVNGRIVTMYGDGNQDYVIALDAATGTTLWTDAIDSMFPPDVGEAGAKSAPTIDGGVVYALGPKGQLLAVRLADGSEIWRVPLMEKAGAVMPEHGFATSPLVAGDLVIVQTGGSPGHSVIALSKKTGDVVWSTGDDSAEYQSPILAELAGAAQVVTVTNNVVRGVDPATGEAYWSSGYGAKLVPSPVLLGDDRILLSGNERSGAFRVRRGSEGFEVSPIWATAELKGDYSTPVVHDGFIYGYDGDFLTCVSADDGKTIWKSRPPGGHGLILVDEHLVILGRGGTVVVADATPGGYHEVAKLDVLDRTSRTYPSFADGRILVRSTSDIAAVTVEHGGGSIGGAARFHEFMRRAHLVIASTFHDILDWSWDQIRRHLGPKRQHEGGPTRVAIAGTVVRATASGAPTPVEGAQVFHQEQPRSAVASQANGRFSISSWPAVPNPVRAYARLTCKDRSIVGVSRPVPITGDSLDVGPIVLRGEPGQLIAHDPLHDLGRSDVRLLASTDVNGDFADDLIVGLDSTAGATFRLLLADGKGGFTVAPSSIHAGGSLGDDLIALTPGSDDVKVVLAYPTRSPAGFTLMLGDGKGTFDDTKATVASLPEPAERAVIADLTTDDPHFLISTRDAGGRGRLYAWSPDQRTAPPTLVRGPLPSPITALGAGDLNGDAKDDALIALADGTCELLAGDGHGGFRVAATLACGPDPREVVVGHVDSDDKTDALVVGGSAGAPGRITWIESNQSGGFDVRTIDLGYPLGSVALAHLVPFFDTVVVTSPPGNELHFLVSTQPDTLVAADAVPGLASTLPADGLATSGPPRRIAVGDFDGDGFVDLAFTATGGVVETYFNRVVPGNADCAASGPAGPR